MNSAQGHFRRELLPTPSAFWQSELAPRKLSRTSLGWARTSCPLHGGTNRSAFSVNLKTGAFYCHSCGAKGDQISFVMQRDRLDFPTAAKALGAWDSGGSISAKEIRRLQQEREQKRASEEARRQQERRERIEARDWLHTLERIQRRFSLRLAELGSGTEESFASEQEKCWEVLAASIDLIRDADAEYCRLAGLEAAEDGI